jgi:hypothetical protein
LLQTWQQCSKHSSEFASTFASNLATVQQTLTKCLNKHLVMLVLGQMQTCNLFNQFKMAKRQLTMRNVLVHLQSAQKWKMLQQGETVRTRNVGR